MTTEQTADSSPAAETEFKRCACGCGVIVNPKSTFVPGHDMKLRSKLLAHWDAGQGAMAEELVERGWYSWEELAARTEKRELVEVAKAERAEARAAKAELNRQAKEDAKAAKKAARQEPVVAVEPALRKRSRTVKARATTEPAAVTA